MVVSSGQGDRGRTGEGEVDGWEDSEDGLWTRCGR